MLTCRSPPLVTFRVSWMLASTPQLHIAGAPLRATAAAPSVGPANPPPPPDSLAMRRSNLAAAHAPCASITPCSRSSGQIPSHFWKSFDDTPAFKVFCQHRIKPILSLPNVLSAEIGNLMTTVLHAAVSSPSGNSGVGTRGCFYPACCLQTTSPGRALTTSGGRPLPTVACLC
jgi:hypothetical protein